jgi:hypothetical protein
MKQLQQPPARPPVPPPAQQRLTDAIVASYIFSLARGRA